MKPVLKIIPVYGRGPILIYRIDTTLEYGNLPQIKYIKCGNLNGSSKWFKGSFNGYQTIKDAICDIIGRTIAGPVEIDGGREEIAIFRELVAAENAKRAAENAYIGDAWELNELITIFEIKED